MWDLFSIDRYLPHYICLAENPSLLATMAGSDAIIAFSYFSIPLGILYFIKERRDLEFKWIAILFILFILWCGITHVTDLITLWVPIYELQATAKFITALVSVLTAVMIWVVMPKALALPSPETHRRANESLQREVEERREAENMLRQARDDLEQRVADRTAELIQLNHQLTEEIKMRKRAQQEQADYAKRLEISNKELDSFASTISHDLRNPINYVKGYSELLLTDAVESSEKRAAYMTIIVDGIDRMDHMIQDLYEFSKLHQNIVCSDVISLQSLIVDLRKIMAAELRDLGASLHYQDTATQIIGNHTLLLLLLQNMIENALKYRSEKAPEIYITVEQSGRQTTVSIADNGRGIPESQYSRVFEIFYRIDPKVEIEGSGIGLATCRRIVERHNGTIWCEANPHGGTIFRFTLPTAV